MASTPRGTTAILDVHVTSGVWLTTTAVATSGSYAPWWRPELQTLWRTGILPQWCATRGCTRYISHILCHFFYFLFISFFYFFLRYTNPTFYYNAYPYRYRYIFSVCDNCTYFNLITYLIIILSTGHSSSLIKTNSESR